MSDSFTPRTGPTPCLCSRCCDQTYIDGGGVSRPGVLSDPTTRRRHVVEDRRRTYRAQRLPRPIESSVATEPPRSSSATTSSVAPPQVGSTNLLSSQCSPIHDGTPHQQDHSERRLANVQSAIKKLGDLESSLVQKSRLLPSSTTLRFKSPPTSLDEPQAPLDEKHDTTARFLQTWTWLNTTSQVLEQPSPLDDKDLTRRNEVLNNKIKREIQRLDSLKDIAWNRLRVQCGLFSEPGSQEDRTPIIPASKWLPRHPPYRILMCDHQGSVP